MSTAKSAWLWVLTVFFVIIIALAITVWLSYKPAYQSRQSPANSENKSNFLSKTTDDSRSSQEVSAIKAFMEEKEISASQ